MKTSTLAICAWCLGPMGLPGQEPAQTPAAPALSQAPSANPGAKPRVAGLVVVRETHEAENGRYRPFGLEPGVRLSLVFSGFSTCLVSFDPVTSRVDTFTDDTGSNLFALTNRLQSPGYLFHQCGVTDDGRLGHVEIFGGTPPSPGATAVHARGVAVFHAASRMEKALSPVGPGAKGETFQAGEKFLFTVTRWEKGGIGGKGITLSLSHASEPSALAALRFLTPEGGEIESRPAGGTTEGQGENRVTILHYQLADNPARCAIEVTHWADIRPMEIPFFVRAGLGGGD